MSPLGFLWFAGFGRSSAAGRLSWDTPVPVHDDCGIGGIVWMWLCGTLGGLLVVVG